MSRSCSKPLQIVIAEPACAFITNMAVYDQQLNSTTNLVATKLRWCYTPGTPVTTTVERSTDGISWTVVGSVNTLITGTGLCGGVKMQTFTINLSQNTQYYFRVTPNTCVTPSSILSFKTVAKQYQIIGMTDCGDCAHPGNPDTPAIITHAGTTGYLWTNSGFSQFGIDFTSLLGIVAPNWVFGVTCDVFYFNSTGGPSMGGNGVPNSTGNVWINPDSAPFTSADPCVTQLTLVPV